MVAVCDLAARPPAICDLLSTVPAAAGTTVDQAQPAVLVDGVLTIDVARSHTFTVVLTSDVAQLVFLGWPASGTPRRVAIYYVQDTVGGHALTEPANIKWASGVPHGLSGAPGAIDCLVYDTFDGGQTIFGNFVGRGYA